MTTRLEDFEADAVQMIRVLEHQVEYLTRELALARVQHLKNDQEVMARFLAKHREAPSPFPPYRGDEP